jgi:hypothetical protein
MIKVQPVNSISISVTIAKQYYNNIRVNMTEWSLHSWNWTRGGVVRAANGLLPARQTPRFQNSPKNPTQE